MALTALGLLGILVLLARSTSTAPALRRRSFALGALLMALGMVLSLIGAALNGEVVRAGLHVVNLILLGLIFLVVRRSRTPN